MRHDTTNHVILGKNTQVIIFYLPTASATTLSVPSTRWRIPDHILVTGEG